VEAENAEVVKGAVEQVVREGAGAFFVGVAGRWGGFEEDVVVAPRRRPSGRISGVGLVLDARGVDRTGSG